MNRECLINGGVELADKPEGLAGKLTMSDNGNGNGKVVKQNVAGAEIDPKLLTSAGDLVGHLAKTLRELHKATTREARIELLGSMHNHLSGLSCRLKGAKLEVLDAIAYALGKLFNTFSRDFDTVNVSSLRTSATALDILGRALKNPDTRLLRNAVFRILVVDDQAVCRHTLSMALNSPHLKLHVSENAADALSLLKSNAYDAVFTDIIMPEMDGFAMTDSLRKITGHERTPVVFVTALSDFETRAKSVLTGGCDLIGKPYSASEVVIKALTIALKHRLEPEASGKVSELVIPAPEPTIPAAADNHTPKPIPFNPSLAVAGPAQPDVSSNGRGNHVKAQLGDGSSVQPEPAETPASSSAEQLKTMAGKLALLEKQLAASQSALVERTPERSCPPGSMTQLKPAVQDVHAKPGPAGQGGAIGNSGADPVETLLERERAERRLLERHCARLEADIQHYLHQLAGHKTLEEGFRQREHDLKRQLEDEIENSRQATQSFLDAQATASCLSIVRPACQAIHDKIQISSSALNEACRDLSTLMALIPVK